MKKIIVLLSVAMVALSAHSQLTVANGGQAIIGQYKAGKQSKSVSEVSLQAATASSVSTHVEVDTLASAVFLNKASVSSVGQSSQYPYFTFGTGKRVWIGETSTSSESSTSLPMLHLEAQGGLEANWSGGSIFQAKVNKSASVEKLLYCIFGTTVKAPEFVTTSDSRLKSNIETIDHISTGLSSIRPVSYQLKANATAIGNEAAKASASDQGDGRTRFGFVAQEVREVYPELVSEDEEGMLGINYDGFIPILVDAIHNLEARVAEQEAEIARLSGGEQKKIAASTDSRLNLISQGAYLHQNRPNPFREKTEIGCAVPEGVASAAIYVYDLQGKQILTEPITERGETTVTIEGNRLQAGMYIYALIADGEEIDSKRMILTE